jgi:hypothetical protein
MAIPREELFKDLNWVTEKISSQVWLLNLGTLGTTWSLLITSTIPDKLKITFFEARWIFVLCILALLCEMGQHLSAYLMYRFIRTKVEQSKATEFAYDTSWWTYRFRHYFFNLKIFLTIAASVFLLGVIIQKLA